MHINVDFCIKFERTHNAILHAKIAQSTELPGRPISQYVKQCMLATLSGDELVFALYVFLFLNSTLCRLESTFWLDSTLQLYSSSSSSSSSERLQR